MRCRSRSTPAAGAASDTHIWQRCARAHTRRRAERARPAGRSRRRTRGRADHGVCGSPCPAATASLGLRSGSPHVVRFGRAALPRASVEVFEELLGVGIVFKQGPGGSLKSMPRTRVGLDLQPIQKVADLLVERLCERPAEALALYLASSG